MKRDSRMKFFVEGVNYKTAPVELREQLAVKLSNLVSRARHAKEVQKLEEILLLSTCNRVEIYGTVSGRLPRTSSVLRSLCVEPLDLRSHDYFYEDAQAVRHLFRVTAGLDSMVLGETEIAGQVKNAYEAARAAQHTGATLNRVFQKAFQTAKEIRARTGIGRGATSVGSVAVELAAKVFRDDFSARSIIIIGAGQMGEACVRHLAKKGARSVLVSNRSIDHAVRLAREFNGQAVRFEECNVAMADADIVIAATGCPKTLLARSDVEALMARRRNRPLILIDISVPRNIEASVQSLDNVFLYNVDDLEEIVRENVCAREQQVVLCHQIIDTHAVALMEKLNLEKERHYDAYLQTQPGWV